MNNRRLTLVRPYDSFMDDFLHNTGLSTIFSGSVEIDLYETDSHIVVKVKAPGYKEDDVKINVENNILTIEGTMKQESEEKEGRKYHIKEMRQESFSRSIPLPTRVDAEKSEASFETGVITINMPKMEDVKPKAITIKTSKK